MGQNGGQMQRVIEGDEPLDITIRRSARARRFSLRVSRLDGRVTLSMPERAREADGLAFVASQRDWLDRVRARAMVARPVGIGTDLPVEGRLVRVTEGPVRAPRLEGAALLVPPGADLAGRRAEAFLRDLARVRLVAASDRHAAALGRPHGAITLRDTRSRWGSCTHDGRLMYAWRLVMAPPDVLDYVAAHEVAHLAEMNHSDRFWSVVRKLRPDYERHRRWLKSQGSALHAYRFRAERADG